MSAFTGRLAQHWERKGYALFLVTIVCGVSITLLGGLLFLAVWALTWHIMWTAWTMVAFDAVITLYWLVMCVGIAAQRLE